jgi:hypothetical protein
MSAFDPKRTLAPVVPVATSRRALAQTSSRMQKNLSAASGGLIAKLTAAIAARTLAYLSFKR